MRQEWFFGKANDHKLTNKCLNRRRIETCFTSQAGPTRRQSDKLKRKITPVIEYAAESTTACLVTMVQGNILGITMTHLLIASQTGVIAAAITVAALFASKSRNRLLVSAVLGVGTAIADYFVHPGMFGPVFLEAIVTGAAAAVLSYMVGMLARNVSCSRPAPGPAICWAISGLSSECSARRCSGFRRT